MRHNNEMRTIQGLKNIREAVIPKIYREENLSEKIVIKEGEALEMTHLMAQKEGVFVGLSSGAAMAAALKVAAAATHNGSTFGSPLRF